MSTFSAELTHTDDTMREDVVLLFQGYPPCAPSESHRKPTHAEKRQGRHQCHASYLGSREPELS